MPLYGFNAAQDIAVSYSDGHARSIPIQAVCAVIYMPDITRTGELICQRIPESFHL